MEKIKIYYFRRSNYGKVLNYIKNKDVAGKLYSLLGTKTIDFKQMDLLISLFGVEFIEVLPEF